MSYVYQGSEPGLWTVGFHTPDGTWHPDFDHDTPDARTQLTRLHAALGEAIAERDRLQDWQNQITHRIPESYDDDAVQETIIERWLDDLQADHDTLRLAGAVTALRDLVDDLSQDPGPDADVLGRVSDRADQAEDALQALPRSVVTLDA